MYLWWRLKLKCKMRNDISMQSSLLIGQRFEGSEEFDNIESVWQFKTVVVRLSVTSSSSWNCFCFCLGRWVKQVTTHMFVVKKKSRFFFLPFFLFIFFFTFWLLVSLAGLFFFWKKKCRHTCSVTHLASVFF